MAENKIPSPADIAVRVRIASGEERNGWEPHGFGVVPAYRPFHNRLQYLCDDGEWRDVPHVHVGRRE